MLVGRSKKDSSQATATNATASASTTSSESEVIIIQSDQHQQNTPQPQTVAQITPLLPIDPSCLASPLAGYDSLPDTPSTVNQPETGQVPAPRETMTHSRNSQLAIPASMSSINASITPPRNFDMTSVSSYQEFAILHWTSPTFSSCTQLGYRLNLVVRCNPNDACVLDIAIKSAQDSHSYHNKYPCSGTAKLMILNPHSNSNHVKCSMRFELQFPSSEAPDFSDGTSVRFPASFIDNDCIYLQVSEVQMDDGGRPWLMNPYLTNDPEQ